MRAIIRLSLAALALLGAAAVHAQEGRSIETVPDRDYFGFDLRTERDVSLQECQAVCLEDRACRAFTYNTRAQWCFLKSDFGDMNPFPGAVAGRVVETAAEPDIGAPPALSFLSGQMVQDARGFVARLSVPEEFRGLGASELAEAARGALVSRDAEHAFALSKARAALTPEDTNAWIEAARAANAVDDNYTIAMESVFSAIRGYQSTRGTQARADALAVLAAALAKVQNYRPALEAYKASLALAESQSVRAAFAELRARQGFRMVDHRIDSDTASPRACVQFSEPLVKSGVDYASFVTLDGASPGALEAKGSEICVEGLAHGGRYRLDFRPGLPSSVGENLEQPVSLDLYVRDRTPSARFTGENFVLPATARRSIPLVSVNAESADLVLYRIGERAIAPLMAESKFLSQMNSYSFDDLEENRGERVWEGTLVLERELNRETVTGFPVDEALPERKPGVYVLTASVTGDRLENWDAKATQWFVVSDIGLSTFAGTDGLTVFVRSLSSAAPLEGVELSLLARNNEVLGTAVSDGEGRVTFSAGLLRGNAAQAPAVLTGQKDGDYVFLDMTRAGFDLSDRGVTGRAAPGAIDLLAWTERGIYRAGETVHAAALARDSEGEAIADLPLTFVFERPDGVEAGRLVSREEALGGHAEAFALQPNAMRGTWRVRVFTDPKAPALGDVSFLVEDFVPDRIEFDLTAEAGEVEAGTPVAVDVEGRFLYGAPASGLTLEGEVALKPARSRAGFEGYVFGLADEETEEASRLPLADPAPLDAEGKSRFEVLVDDLPATTQWLDAEVTVRMREAGGRAVERALTLPVAQSGPMIGIRPEFSGSVPEGGAARFHVIATEGAEGRTALAGAHWKLVKVERRYQWYRDGNSWRFEPVLSTSLAADGVIDVAAEGSSLAVPVGWGRYRLEIEAGEAATSAEFDAGWYVEASSTETPDALEIALDKEDYAVGETARLKISPRHAGEVLVTAGTERLIFTRNVSIGAEGGEIEIPVTEDWGGGAYVAATLYRPGDAQESRMPMRAIGIKWLAVDPGARKLAVTLDPPEQVLPRGPLEIPVSVSGAGVGEEAWVTVAAVDVGILNLTRYEMPDPEGWYFGQRRLGLEIRDLYGRLIDDSLGSMGRLRTGGDGAEMALQASPPTEKLVAFFSGPVRLDAEGKATVSFDLPQFNGTARVMAVAWSKSGVGHARKDVVIRDPVVVTASLPKFLSPGDSAELRLDIANTDAPAGNWRLSAIAEGGLSVGDTEAGREIALEPGGREAVTLPLAAERIGDGTIRLALSGPEGQSLDQVLNVPVRPATPPVTVRREIAIAPGQSLTVDRGLLAGSLLEGASVSLAVTRTPAFDVAAIAMMLDRYPYGCAEQTVSRALPLLYLDEVAALADGPEDADLRRRVEDAIARVLAFQSSAGSFGLWRPDSGDLWLDSYVTDFLTRARERGYAVPEEALAQALDNLQNSIAYANIKERGNDMAYALYVLARNRKASISDLRYYADTAIGDLPTPLARGQLAAALALYGDPERAQGLFRDAMDLSVSTTNVSLSRADYGSALRDDAALLALAAESRPAPGIVQPMTERVSREWQAKDHTSTQEQVWMMLAARALKGADEGLDLAVNGVAREGGYRARMSGEELARAPLDLANRSGEPVFAAITAVAAPEEPLPAGGDGFVIERAYYTLDGEPANVSEAAQNERYVAVLTVTPEHAWPQRILVTDLLPAGFEIDNPKIVGSADLANFEWIGDAEPAHVEFRNDRFVAAFNRGEGEAGEITLAYVVRAVTPGTYAHPAASVEDMYRPQFSARTASGAMAVRAAR